jgi:hypothetical protein
MLKWKRVPNVEKPAEFFKGEATLGIVLFSFSPL